MTLDVLLAINLPSLVNLLQLIACAQQWPSYILIILTFCPSQRRIIFGMIHCCLLLSIMMHDVMQKVTLNTNQEYAYRFDKLLHYWFHNILHCKFRQKIIIWIFHTIDSFDYKLNQLIIINLWWNGAQKWYYNGHQSCARRSNIDMKHEISVAAILLGPNNIAPTQVNLLKISKKVII